MESRTNGMRFFPNKATFNTIITDKLVFSGCVESIGALGSVTVEPVEKAVGPGEVLLINRN